MAKKKEKTIINTSVIMLVYVLVVIVAKIIRYTVLKATLVDNGVANSMIDIINFGNPKFIFGSDGLAINNAVVFFKVFKIFGISTITDYEIFITIFWNFIMLMVILKVQRKISLVEFIFLVMSVGVVNIWDFCLAKEPVQMLYFVLLFYILMTSNVKNKNKFFLVILTILFECFTFRFYYILALILFIGAYFLFEGFIIKKKKFSFISLIEIMIFFGFAYFCMLNITKVIAPEYYNEFMYFNYKITSAKTDIFGLFRSSNLFIVTIDYLILVIRMLFPIELFRFGVSYGLYAVYQVFLSILLFKSLFNIRNLNYINRLAMYIFIGFLFASATFEPDFGSWVRHEAVALPVVLIAMNLNMPIKSKKRDDNNA